MGRKETIAVTLLFSTTAILKIYSIVALSSKKPHSRISEQTTSLCKHTLYKDVLLAGDTTAAIPPAQEVTFKQTLLG